jgi:cell division protein FtsN
MTKPVTGQYECLHRSGIGLDYFTSRVDRLTLYPNGRFALITQNRSRAVNAAQSLMSGQAITSNAPETRREGSYTRQDRLLIFSFDDGAQMQAQIAWNEEGLQIDTNFFQKVSDSTVLPPTHRLKQDMDDIAKGIKIATTIGGIALKAAKGIHETIQTIQTPAPQTSQPAPVPQPPMQQQQAESPAPTPAYPSTPTPPSVAQQAPTPMPQQATPAQVETLYCDQCGAPARPGKRFCNQCGARLP